MKKEPGKGKPLALAAGKPAAIFAQPCHKAMGHGADKLLTAGVLYGPAELLVCNGPVDTVKDIFPDRPRKKEGSLGSVTDHTPPFLQRKRRNIPAADPDHSPVRGIKAFQKLENGGFSSPAGPNERRHFSLCGCKGKMFQDRLLSIGKRHVPEAYIPLDKA